MIPLLLLACGGSEPDSGALSEDTAADPSTAALVGLSATADPDPESIERALEGVGRVGAIDVTHQGLVAACDVTWTATMTFTPPDTFAVSYTRSDSDNDPSGCAWTLDYALVPVPEGTWTVSAAGESTQVPVPG